MLGNEAVRREVELVEAEHRAHLQLRRRTGRCALEGDVEVMHPLADALLAEVGGVGPCVLMPARLLH